MNFFKNGVSLHLREFEGCGPKIFRTTPPDPLTTKVLDTQRGEWPSGPASSISLTEVKHGCVRSETGWATFQMNDQNSSLSRSSEGTLN